jgi:C-terminal processing protease CtpA/Prc
LTGPASRPVTRRSSSCNQKNRPRSRLPWRVATVGREQRSTLPCNQRDKLLKSGFLVPLDATEAEINGKLASITQDRFLDRVSPTHYPSNEKLYYAGFEVLILKNPAQVLVLGIEDGPASRAGAHWGDTILSVKGIDPRNKTVAQLEPLFSSQKPGCRL